MSYTMTPVLAFFSDVQSALANQWSLSVSLLRNVGVSSSSVSKHRCT